MLRNIQIISSRVVKSIQNVQSTQMQMISTADLEKVKHQQRGSNRCLLLYLQLLYRCKQSFTRILQQVQHLKTRRQFVNYISNMPKCMSTLLRIDNKGISRDPLQQFWRQIFLQQAQNKTNLCVSGYDLTVEPTNLFKTCRSSIVWIWHLIDVLVFGTIAAHQFHLIHTTKNLSHQD